MKNLKYGTFAILISDAAANAVLHYAAILAQAGDSDVVDIPTCDTAGCRTWANVVLGPGVPLMAVAAPDDAMEQEDADFVEQLTIRVQSILSDTARHR
ncbi:hypothetical protein [Curtobacterium sp. PhB115]|uniref:hypothetical protein n=1 Tax=Curtobacterium sp. PhB115 TaxID=2485173 RepID=UPI000F4C3D74|nr:hypothetical protein [Curtobacterium sp. PhB115]ROP58681.1 hypothetical protein EDF19_3713 [Curtobacterium sp. PhB115]